jgi:HK97 family phage major capsid protein
MAEVALERRASLVADLQRVANDTRLTKPEKDERAAKLTADIQAAEAEARSYVEDGEREREVRDAADKMGLTRVTVRGAETQVDEKRYAAGLWLSNEIRLTTGASGIGAAVTPAEYNSKWFDRLAPMSILLASGVNVIRTERDSLQIPRLTGDVSASFVAEGDTIPGSDASGDTVTATPRKVATISTLTNEVIADSDPRILEVYAKSMLRALALRFDLAGFEGTGVSPQITGLKSVVGITNQNVGANGSTPANLDFIADALSALEQANAEGRAIAMHPRTWGTLSKIKEVTGSAKPVLQESAGSAGQGVERRIYGVPVFLSSQLSVTETQGTSNDASSVYVYDPTQLYAVLRADARVELDDKGLFDQDKTRVRAIMRADLVVANPAAVVRIAGVRA